MTVAAFDLSLTSTGYARADLVPGTYPWQCSITTEALVTTLTGLARIDYLTRAVLDRCDGADLIIFEDLSYGSNDPGAQERAGLAYCIRYQLHLLGLSFHLITPSRLKKWATGRGNAKKDEIMLAVYKRWGIETRTSDEADAVALATLGLALAGGDAGKLTKEQLEVLAAIRNPKAK